MLQQVVQRLQDEVPELNQVVLNIGQTGLTIPAAMYPLALVNASTIEWTPVHQGKRRGKALIEIEIHPVACKVLEDVVVADDYPQSIAWWDLVKKVDSAMNGLRINEFTQLSCTRIRQRRRYFPSPILLSYTCSISAEQ